MRRKFLAIWLMCLLFINMLPLTLLAAGDSMPPERPYEKVVARSGSWFAEQLSHGEKSNLVIAYKGDRKASGNFAMELKLKEEIVVTGVYIPGLATGEGEVSLSLTDGQGNIYKGFSMEKQVNSEITKSETLESESTISNDNKLLIFTPSGDMLLPAGSYTLTAEGDEGLADAFLIKGIHAGAYKKYKETLLEWELENNPEISGEEEAGQTFGEKGLTTKDKMTYGSEISETAGPPIFGLDAEYQIDEIIVSTYNNGQGAAPGIIALIGEDGQMYYSGQAYGVSMEGIANAAWKIAPGILLPSGQYLIALSQPEVLSYDGEGEALFYVKASIPVQLRPDFTGTYRINLDAFKTSTLMGPVTEVGSSFSLKDFELTVLDKEGELELIGKYEGVPFSQGCQVLEETPEGIVAQFSFAVDLTKLPYQANISADARVTLTVDGNGIPQIEISGVSIYDRAASKDKGADHNTYDLRASGLMTQRELPPFVMTALGKAGSAGSVPGPDNAAQATVGMLFPPLVGLVVNVLQELLKPKVPAKKAARDKNWYKEKYPGKTDEQLAMIMLADAMGNTDEPDEGDAVSIGDYLSGEPTGETDYGVLEGDLESTYESDYHKETEPTWEYGKDYDSTPDSGSAEREAWSATEGEQIPYEPETMVLKTSANGAESLYVKDPATGEWVNSETGGILDLEKYPEAMEQMQQNKEWSQARDQEIQSRGGSEHDKDLRENMQKIREEERKTAKENALRKKYGIDDLVEIERIVVERKARAEEWARIWQRNDKILGAMEIGAVVVETAADAGIDGLSVIVPGGSGFKVGYKVVKGMAGTMADAGAQGKDVFTLANAAEGAVKGAADAALDKIPGGESFVGKTLSTLGKGALTTGGEGAGAGIGAALRGEDVGEAIEKGLKEGAYKAATGFVTDQISGDLPNPIINRGSFKAVPNLKNVIVSKSTGIKAVSKLADEYAVKPVIMGE